MSLNNIKKLQSQRGFTLVELLIVIVIIAILAAITIVAYNGITNRAHASAAKQAAQNVVTKAEAYNAEAPSGSNGYPATWGALTGAASTTSYNLPASAVTIATAVPTAGPAKDNSVWMSTCVNTAGGPIVGVLVGYWDYANSRATSKTTDPAALSAGDTSGTCTLLTATT